MKRAIVLVALVTATAHAYVLEESNWNPASLPIPYRINTGSIPSEIASTGVTSVENGFATWAGPTCTSWRATDAGSTSAAASSSDRQNTIVWLSGSWPAELGDVSTVIGITTPVWTVGAYFIDADIRFNNVGFTWSTTGSRGTVDTQSIATHEEGHFLGLGHSPLSAAIMYAAYPGGIKRMLNADDQNGVCTIYPSGSMPPPPVDAGSGADPCNAHGTTCDACTPYDGCGFCGATSRCVRGTETGPLTGTCASGYVWFPADCTTTSPGTGRFGDPCSGPGDCGTGGVCIGTRAGTAFCSRACTDDCSCPDGYACFGTSDPTLDVCAPGTRDCAPPGVDAGPPPPPADGGHVIPPPPVDGGHMIPPAEDGGHVVDMDGGTVMPDVDGGHRRGGGRGACACSTPGAPAPSMPWGLGIGLGLALALSRRRR